MPIAFVQTMWFMLNICFVLAYKVCVQKRLNIVGLRLAFMETASNRIQLSKRIKQGGFRGQKGIGRDKAVIIWTCSGNIINKAPARTKQRKTTLTPQVGFSLN